MCGPGGGFYAVPGTKIHSLFLFNMGIALSLAA